MTNSYRGLMAASASVATLLLATGAHAQATAPAASGQTLGEVVVTAERTVSTVQKTPISVVAVSGQQLESRGINNIGLLTNIEPTIAFSSGQFNGASIAVRGVSSSGSTQFGGSAVTINTDGQYIYTGFNGVLYDVDRIEVLKGPQGTLYGLNATAGAVNILTNAPKFRNSFDLRGETGNYGYKRAEVTGNWAATDTLAFRATFMRELRDGFREHFGMDTSDRRDVAAGRVSALWKPIDKLSIRLTGEQVNENLGNAANQGIVLSASASNPAGSPPRNITYQSLGLDPYNWPLNYAGWNHSYATIVRGNLAYDFGPATLTYITSWNHTAASHCQPAFGTRTIATDHCSVDGDRNNYSETMEHEARLNGATPFGLKWQGGVFYSRFKLASNVDIFNGVTSLSVPHTVAFIHFLQPDNHETNTAVYGQLSQSITDKLSLTGGLRYTEINQAAVNNISTALNVGAYLGSGGKTLLYVPTNNSGTSKYDKTTWHLGLDYQVTPVNLFYVSVGTSFKDGGFTQFNTYAPENITAYEIGSKNRFFDNRVQVNGAIYYYDYTGQQAQVFVTRPDGTAPLTTVNAGNSNLKGGEASLVWQATEADRLSGGVTYSDAKFTKFTVAQPVIPLGSVTSINANLAGNRPPNAPNWTITAGWDHTWKFYSGNLTSSVNTRYVTDYYLSVFNQPGDKVKGFMQTDLSLTMTSPDGKLDASVFVRNVENNTTLNFSQFLVQGVPIYMFGWAPPRTFGVRLGAHF